MILKIACWPVFLFGTLYALARAHIPYIPTAKEAAAGHFQRLAAPHLTLLGLFASTLVWTAFKRLTLVPEIDLMLTSEATWGMVAFASVAIATTSGAVYAAWSSRKVPGGQPWETINLMPDEKTEQNSL
jgi:hypothetical protein